MGFLKKIWKEISVFGLVFVIFIAVGLPCGHVNGFGSTNNCFNKLYYVLMHYPICNLSFVSSIVYTIITLQGRCKSILIVSIWG